MSLNTKILVVDDDPELRDLICAFLRSHGFSADAVADGDAMREAMANGHVDLVVLDLIMPGEDGLSILGSLGPDAPPIILLSGMATEVDRIVGLELGADDYLAKPCNPRELLARIRAVLRRYERTAVQTPKGSTLRFEEWTLDAAGHLLADPDGVPVMLTSVEFRLLLAFAERPRRVLSRDQLLDLAYGDAGPFDRTVDVQISRLRRKIARPGRDELIRTVHSEGYLFAPAVVRT